MKDARRFTLERTTDVTGVSGVGTVADGVLWPDNTVTIRWRGDRPSTVNWSRMEHAIVVHGHGGLTTVKWLDPLVVCDGDTAQAFVEGSEY